MLHLMKLAVGVTDLDQFSARVQARREGGLPSQAFTRNLPKRGEEILEGGSLYWVVAGILAARQRITGFAADERQDGTKCVRIELASDLVRVAPRHMRAFRGWRYLPDANAPPDIGSRDDLLELGDMPPHMRKVLLEYCLI